MPTSQIIREPEFAKRMRASRRALGLTQVECARRLGLSRQHWNNWETGLSKPYAPRLAQVAELLKCSPDWLRNGDSGDTKEVLERVARLMRMVVRDIDHIQKSLGG